MAVLEEKLQQLTKKLDVTIKSIKAYRDLLEKTGFSGSAPDEYEFISGIVVPELVLASDVAALFKLYRNIMKADMDLTRTIEIFQRYRITSRQIGMTSSSTTTITAKYVTDLSDSLEILQDRAIAIRRDISDLDLQYEIPSRLGMEDAKTTEKLIALSAELQKVYLSYVNANEGIIVIDCFVSCLNNIYRISANLPGSAALVTHIDSMLEQLRMDILMSPGESVALKLPNVIQSMIQTHRMYPVFNGTIADIMKHLGVASKSSELMAVLTNAAKLLKMGFIVIQKVTSAPRQHDITGIINPQQPVQDINAGINNATIRRTETIRPLEFAGESALSSVSPKPIIISSGAVSHYYFLQTLDMVNYSVMSPWQEWKIPATMFTIRDGRIMPSERIQAYNIIMEPCIVSSLVAPYIEPLTVRTEIDRADAYWNSVRIKLKQPLLEQYRTDLKVIKHTMAAVTKMLLESSDQHVNAIANTAIADLSENLTNDSLRRELAVSYLRSYADMARKYRKRYQDVIAEHAIDLERAIKRDDISSVLDKILEEQLKIFVNRKSGIFITIANCIDIHRAVFAKPI
jgi:hypothetical protein